MFDLKIFALKKNLRRVLFEVTGIRGQWVNDDTIFLVSRSDTISSKSGIEGRILSHISISLCVIYVYDVARRHTVHDINLFYHQFN